MNTRMTHSKDVTIATERHGHLHQNESNHHSHDHNKTPFGWLREAIPFLHGHRHGAIDLDAALESSNRGIWALKVSLLGLGATAIFQVAVVLMSGSVALLADTLHNFADALTAIPLWLAFAVGRRAASRRFTYGYGRAEDVAGVIIVAVIFVSALVAGYESYERFLNPVSLTNIGWVMTAAVIGFLGNETVALYRIRIGREIGSAALIADGHHSRIDGLTSLAVLFGALGSLAGFPAADPIVGLAITFAILFVIKDAAILMLHRLMDAVDPEVTANIDHVAAGVAEVQGTHSVRVRWLGHRLQAELHVLVDEDLPTRESHRIVEEVRHALFHAEPRLVSVNVHVDPCGHNGKDPHELTAHHLPSTVARGQHGSH